MDSLDAYFGDQVDLSNSAATLPNADTFGLDSMLSFGDQIGTFITASPYWASSFMAGVDSSMNDLSSMNDIANLGLSDAGLSDQPSMLASPLPGSQADLARTDPGGQGDQGDQGSGAFAWLKKKMAPFEDFAKSSPKAAEMLMAGIGKGIQYYLTKNQRQAQSDYYRTASQAAMMNAQTNQQAQLQREALSGSAAGVKMPAGMINATITPIRKINPITGV